MVEQTRQETDQVNIFHFQLPAARDLVQHCFCVESVDRLLRLHELESELPELLSFLHFLGLLCLLVLFEVNGEQLGEQAWLLVVLAELLYFVEASLVDVLLNRFFVFFFLDEELDVLIGHPGALTDSPLECVNAGSKGYCACYLLVLRCRSEERVQVVFHGYTLTCGT